MGILTGIVPSNPSPQLDTVLAFLQGWVDIDIDAVLSVLVDDDQGLQYSVGPTSLELPTMHSKADIHQFFDIAFVERIQSYSIEVVDIIKSCLSDRVVVRTRQAGLTTLGRKTLDDYLWTFTFESTPFGPGTKISTVHTFTDSKSVTDLFLEEDHDHEDEEGL